MPQTAQASSAVSLGPAAELELNFANTIFASPSQAGRVIASLATDDRGTMDNWLRLSQALGEVPKVVLDKLQAEIAHLAATSEPARARLFEAARGQVDGVDGYGQRLALAIARKLSKESISPQRQMPDLSSPPAGDFEMLSQSVLHSIWLLRHHADDFAGIGARVSRLPDTRIPQQAIDDRLVLSGLLFSSDWRAAVRGQIEARMAPLGRRQPSSAGAAPAPSDEISLLKSAGLQQWGEHAEAVSSISGVGKGSRYDAATEKVLKLYCALDSVAWRQTTQQEIEISVARIIYREPAAATDLSFLIQGQRGSLPSVHQAKLASEIYRAVTGHKESPRVAEPKPAAAVTGHSKISARLAALEATDPNFETLSSGFTALANYEGVESVTQHFTALLELHEFLGNSKKLEDTGTALLRTLYDWARHKDKAREALAQITTDRSETRLPAAQEVAGAILQQLGVRTVQTEPRPSTAVANPAPPQTSPPSGSGTNSQPNARSDSPEAAVRVLGSFEAQLRSGKPIHGFEQFCTSLSQEAERISAAQFVKPLLDVAAAAAAAKNDGATRAISACLTNLVLENPQGLETVVDYASENSVPAAHLLIIGHLIVTNSSILKDRLLSPKDERLTKNLEALLKLHDVRPDPSLVEIVCSCEPGINAAVARVDSGQSQLSPALGGLLKDLLRVYGTSPVADELGFAIADLAQRRESIADFIRSLPARTGPTPAEESLRQGARRLRSEYAELKLDHAESAQDIQPLDSVEARRRLSELNAGLTGSGNSVDGARAEFLNRLARNPRAVTAGEALAPLATYFHRTQESAPGTQEPIISALEAVSAHSEGAPGTIAQLMHSPPSNNGDIRAVIACGLLRASGALKDRYLQDKFDAPATVANGLFNAALSLAGKERMGTLSSYLPKDATLRRCELVQVLVTRAEFAPVTRQRFLDIFTSSSPLAPEVPELVDDVLAAWEKTHSAAVRDLIIELTQKPRWDECFKVLPPGPHGQGLVAKMFADRAQSKNQVDQAGPAGRSGSPEPSRR